MGVRGWWGRGRECVRERRDMNHGVARVFKVWRLAFLRAVVAVLTSDDGCQAGNFGNRFEVTGIGGTSIGMRNQYPSSESTVLIGAG